MPTVRLVLWVATLTAAMAPAAMAQSRATTADLTGTVADQTGDVLPGATVTATNMATNAVRDHGH